MVSISEPFIRRPVGTTLLAIGLFLVGIVKKNGIMMVDFALDAERQRGLSSAEAIFEACQARGAERLVLLLRVHEDQQLDPVLDWLDGVADAQRFRLAAMRAVRDFWNGAGRV